MRNPRRLNNKFLVESSIGGIVSHPDSCKEKLAQNLQRRQTKPFIDQNLQFQLPDVANNSNHRSHSPIYSHYMGSSLRFLI